MKKVIYLSAILLMLAACHDMRVSERLDQVDSLVVREQYDSACVVLNNLDGTAMAAEDQAHYCLLSTKLGYLTNQPLPSDSMLDLALAYYKKEGNNEKLADAYYYKSASARFDNDFPRAILYGKEAERFAISSDDTCLLFKIVENLAYLNGLCENDVLQLQYAKKALAIAQKVQNKHWIAYTYNKICFAFANLDQDDSANYYIEKSTPLFKYVSNSDKPGYLANIGMFYKNDDSNKAKKYLEMALSYGEVPGIYENLADIYYAEGKKAEAYKYWKKALSTSGRYERDDIIHSIIAYNLEQGDIDEASKHLDQVIAIKDSIITVLRNDTIKDLQLRYDHEVEMNAANERMIHWQWVLGGLILFVLCLVGYILWKKHKTRLRQMEYDMQLSAFSHQTLELQMAITKAENQILELKSAESQNQAEIQRLEQVKEKARREMDEMEEKMRQWHDKEAEKIRKGVKLYDGIVKNEKAQTWTQEDYDAFIAFYEIGHYSKVKSFRREYTEITPRNMLYLILTDMGKTNEDISHILGIDLNSIRSIRHRLNIKKNED